MSAAVLALMAAGCLVVSAHQAVQLNGALAIAYLGFALGNAGMAWAIA